MERTKAEIVEAFQELLETTPINKITVKGIAERCKINRNTFYYYFNGLPDLMDYQLTAMADYLIDSVEQPVAKEELTRIVNYLTEHKNAILHAYRYLPREEFISMFDKITLYVVQGSIDKATEGVPISEEDRTFLIRCFKCALVGLFLDWLEAGMRYDMGALIVRLCDLMDGSTYNVIKKCLEKQQ